MKTERDEQIDGSPEPSHERSRLERIVLARPALWIFAAAVLLYLPAVQFGFVWDDQNNLETDSRLREWRALWMVFIKPAMWSAGFDTDAMPTYRPLALGSFVTDFKLFGPKPWGFHLTSIVLHGLTMVAVFFALRRWLTVGAAFGIALFCAVHPFGVPAAAWINGRSELFALGFGAAALALVPAERGQWARLLGVALCVAGAALGKETGAAFAILVVAAAALPPLDDPGRRLRWRPDVLAAAAAGLLLWFAMRAVALADAVSLAQERDPMRALLAVGPTVFRGLQSVLAPLDRAPVMLHAWLNGLSEPEALAYNAAAAALLLVGIWLFKARRWYVAFGLAWWFGTQAAVPLLALVDWPGHYRWLYLGLPGLALAVYAAWIRTLGARAQRAILLAAVVVASVLTTRALPAWKSNGQLWAEVVHQHPEHPLAYLGVASELLRFGRDAEAEDMAAKSAERGQSDWLVYSVWATSLARQDRCDEAMSRFRLFKDEPMRGQMHTIYEVGQCYHRVERPGPARRAFEFCAAEFEPCEKALEIMTAPAAPSGENP